MSEFLDRAIALTRQNREANLVSIEIKELGTIYFKPLAALSVDSFDKVLTGEGAKNQIEGLIDVLIIRCLGANGMPLFSPMDKIQMKKELGPLLIAEIYRNMGAAEAESQTVEEIEKNL